MRGFLHKPENRVRGFLHKPQNRVRGFLHRRLLRGFLLRGFLLRAHFVRVFFRLPLLYTIVTCVIAFHVSQFLLTQEHLVSPSKG